MNTKNVINLYKAINTIKRIKKITEYQSISNKCKANRFLIEIATELKFESNNQFNILNFLFLVGYKFNFIVCYIVHRVSNNSVTTNINIRYVPFFFF